MGPERQRSEDDVQQRTTIDGSGMPETPAPSGGEVETIAVAHVAEADATAGFPVQGWDRYEFQGFLGQGGMGRVYRAFDPRLKRAVALKFIREDSPELNRRFLQEAQAQARVEHPHVCRVYEVGEVQGRLFIAMPFLDGQPLQTAAREMSLEQKVRVVCEVAEGLHAAHRMGLVHRDVKPQNVIVERTPEGELHPYVMDFGLARQAQDESLTATGTLLGTPWYMAPEQALGRRQVDRRADVYSLGASFYELLCGRPPFVGAGPMEVLHQVLSDEPRSPRDLAPGLPVDLETIVLKCLEKEPDRRYESCRALADDLHRFLDGEPISARATTLFERVSRRARRNPALTASLAALVLVILGFAVYALWSAFDTRRRLVLAQELGQEAKELEVLMRFAAYTQPLHDVRRERGLVRQRLAALQEKVRRLGSAARGPGDYALGRGHLVLGDYQVAFDHLKKAWDGGYRTPDVAYALGQAHAWLFWRGETEARTAASSEERKRRRDALIREHLEPALGYLGQARGVGLDAPEYLEAYVAFLKDDWDRAIERSGAAIARAAWFYEARIIRARAFGQRGAAKRDRGDTEAALRDFAAADAEYRAAIEAARSAPDARAGRCLLFNQQIDLEMLRGRSPDEVITRGIEICGHVLAVDPEDGDTLLNLSDLYWQRAELARERGADPRPDLREAIAVAERTLTAGKSQAYAWDNLGIANTAMAEYELQHGGDPIPWLDRAAAHLTSCMTRYPTFVTCYCNAGAVELMRADHALERGRDVSAFVEAVRSLVERGERVRMHYCLPLNAVVADVSAARSIEASGGDPSPALDRLQRALEETRAVNPSLFVTESMAVRGALIEARWALRQRKPAGTAIGKAKLALARARELNPEDPALPLLEGEIALIRARVEVSAVRWSEAQRAYAEAVRRASRRADSHLGVARAACLGAERYGATSAEQLKAGLKAAENALAIHPALGEAFLLKACFERHQPNQAAARRSAARGIELNPLLAREYPLLAQGLATR